MLCIFCFLFLCGPGEEVDCEEVVFESWCMFLLLIPMKQKLCISIGGLFFQLLWGLGSSPAIAEIQVPAASSPSAFPGAAGKLLFTISFVIVESR